MQVDKVVLFTTNPEPASLRVLNLRFPTISLTQVNQVGPLTTALLFLPPPMAIPETGTESTEPTLLTMAEVVDKVDVWRLDLPLHEYQTLQHSDLQEAGRRVQASNRDMTTR